MSKIINNLDENLMGIHLAEGSRYLNCNSLFYLFAALVKNSQIVRRVVLLLQNQAVAGDFHLIKGTVQILFRPLVQSFPDDKIIAYRVGIEINNPRYNSPECIKTKDHMLYGDILVVDRSLDPRNGKIIVAVVDGEC